MNRHERRRQVAKEKRNGFYNSYVRHLPEVGPEAIRGSGVFHIAILHDGWCRIYDGKPCNCEPNVRFFAEPNRS